MHHRSPLQLDQHAAADRADLYDLAHRRRSGRDRGVPGGLGFHSRRAAVTAAIVAAIAGIGSVTTYAIAQSDGDEPPALPAVEWPDPMGGKAPLTI